MPRAELVSSVADSDAGQRGSVGKRCGRGGAQRRMGTASRVVRGKKENKTRQTGRGSKKNKWSGCKKTGEARRQALIADQRSPGVASGSELLTNDERDGAWPPESPGGEWVWETGSAWVWARQCQQSGSVIKRVALAGGVEQFTRGSTRGCSIDDTWQQLSPEK